MIGVRPFLTWAATYAARVMHGQRRSMGQIALGLARHRVAALVAFTCAAAITLLGTFVPWLRSGTTSRSSYDLLGLLTRLEFAPGGTVATMVRWWPVVPLLITGAVVAAWWQQTWVAVAAAVVSVLYAGGVGTAVVVASRDTGIDVGPGPWVCAVGSAGLLLAAAWLAIANVTNARRRDLPTPHAAPLDGPS
jgi:hypothetical protein